MVNGNRKNLLKFRTEQAKESLEAAKKLAKDGYFKDSANRSYYCIFQAMRAVLALDGFDSKKHSGVIAYFRQNYIKTGKFNTEFSKIIGDSFKVRNNSDYEDFYVVSKDSVMAQIKNAELFLKAVEDFVGGVG